MICILRQATSRMVPTRKVAPALPNHKHHEMEARALRRTAPNPKPLSLKLNDHVRENFVLSAPVRVWCQRKPDEKNQSLQLACNLDDINSFRIVNQKSVKNSIPQIPIFSPFETVVNVPVVLLFSLRLYLLFNNFFYFNYQYQSTVHCKRNRLCLLIAISITAHFSNERVLKIQCIMYEHPYTLIIRFEFVKYFPCIFCREATRHKYNLPRINAVEVQWITKSFCVRVKFT